MLVTTKFSYGAIDEYLSMSTENANFIYLKMSDFESMSSYDSGIGCSCLDAVGKYALQILDSVCKETMSEQIDLGDGIGVALEVRALPETEAEFGLKLLQNLEEVTVSEKFFETVDTLLCAGEDEYSAVKTAIEAMNAMPVRIKHSI